MIHSLVVHQAKLAQLTLAYEAAGQFLDRQEFVNQLMGEPPGRDATMRQTQRRVRSITPQSDPVFSLAERSAHWFANCVKKGIPSGQNFLRGIATAILVLFSIGCQHGRPESRPGSSLRSHRLRQSGSPWVFVSQFAGITYTFDIPDDIFSVTPKWKAETDPLPLAPSRAEQAAIEEANRLHPTVGNWSMDGISLRRLLFSDCWFYEVKLLRGDIVLGGQPFDDDFLTIPVLMDGAAVHPRPPR